MARPLPPKNDAGFWSFVNDFDLLVRLAREKNGMTWKGERLTVARDLHHALGKLVPDVDVLKRNLAFSVAFWCDRTFKMPTKVLQEIARKKYLVRVSALVERHKGYLAEMVLTEGENG